MMELLGLPYRWLDERLHIGRFRRRFLTKAFPVHDSYILGELALFSFATLVITGVFLALFYIPSTSKVIYDGALLNYRGKSLPEAFASVIYITYDLPMGMLIRQVHHWAANIFIASISLHMLRVLFTGAYRKPREVNWIIGIVLINLAIVSAFSGYTLPYDQFAATAATIGYNVFSSPPIVGEYIGNAVFAGGFPSQAAIPRLYSFHLLLAALIAVTIGLHMTVLIKQRHTEPPRAGDPKKLVGVPLWPNQAFASAMYLFALLAFLFLLGGFLSPHNIAVYGPEDPTTTPTNIAPDWYLMWLFGLLKLVPSAWGITIGGIIIKTEFIGGVLLPGVIWTAIVLLPFIDRSEREENFIANPLDRPFPTALGVLIVTFLLSLAIGGQNDRIAAFLGLGIREANLILFAAIILASFLAGALTYAILRRRRASLTV